MSFSSSSNRNSRLLHLELLPILGMFFVGCGCGCGHAVSTRKVTTTTEPEVASVDASMAAPPSPIVESEQQLESPPSAKPSPAPAEKRDEHLERKRAPAAHRSRAKEGSPKAQQRDARSAAKAEPAFAEPSFSEPPELSQALNEFETQATALSTNRTCDTACQALESMRRSAQKICDLVADGDPRARCSSARARLEQASRELSARCTTCR